jgi:transmembrane 9 superfamily protein 2/4
MRARWLAAVLCYANAFYLPGVSPKTFKKGERIKLRVNKLTSTQTQLPYDYYSLPFPQVICISLLFFRC